ncbi:MAG: alkaline phosphatase family protein [Hyphomicrobiaceae bacterium]
MARDNILFITLDQLRADCIAGPLADQLELPNLRSLMTESITFAKHFSVATPCGPARTSLLTGLYAMNHRSVRNGAPLDSNRTNIALELRKAGYEPLLYGCTDISIDPRGRDPDDPDVRTYEGLLPGFREVVRLRYEESHTWHQHLQRQGYRLSQSRAELFQPHTSDGRPSAVLTDPAFFGAEHSETAFLTDCVIEDLESPRAQGWCAHVTYIRPHPPLVAPHPYNTLYDPDALTAPVRAGTVDDQIRLHPFFEAYFSEPAIKSLYAGFDGRLVAMEDERVAVLRAIYCGLVSELDTQIGRLLEVLNRTGQYERTLIIVTSDHGEMLGDHFMWGKDNVYDAAFHVPLIIRDPQRRGTAGRVVPNFTESIDLAPTLLGWSGQPVPAALDGVSLLPWLDGEAPSTWRDHVFAEVDIGNPVTPTRYQRHLGLKLAESNFALLRTERLKLVHFNGGLPPLLFDLEKDPGELVNVADDPDYARDLKDMLVSMLDHRMTHADQTLSRMALTSDGVQQASSDA